MRAVELLHFKDTVRDKNLQICEFSETQEDAFLSEKRVAAGNCMNQQPVTFEIRKKDLIFVKLFTLYGTCITQIGILHSIPWT